MICDATSLGWMPINGLSTRRHDFFTQSHSVAPPEALEMTVFIISDTKKRASTARRVIIDQKEDESRSSDGPTTTMRCPADRVQPTAATCFTHTHSTTKENKEDYLAVSCLAPARDSPTRLSIRPTQQITGKSNSSAKRLAHDRHTEACVCT